MYLGNGTTASQVNAVMALEATSSGGNITAVVPYAYRGQYESSFTATLPAAGVAFSRNHNIGVTPSFIDFIIECTTAEFGYSIGDQIHASSLRTVDAVPIYATITLGSTRKAVFGKPAGNVAWSVQSQTTGAFITLTLASWKYKLTASRQRW